MYIYIYIFSLLTSNGRVFCSVDVLRSRNVLEIFTFSSCKLREEKILIFFFFLLYGMHYFTVTLFSLKKDIITQKKKTEGDKELFSFFLFRLRYTYCVGVASLRHQFHGCFSLTHVSHTFTTNIMKRQCTKCFFSPSL